MQHAKSYQSILIEEESPLLESGRIQHLFFFLFHSLPPLFFNVTMNSSYHTSAENGHGHSDTRRHERDLDDRYDLHQRPSAKAYQRDKDVSTTTITTTKDSGFSNSNLLINRDDIVLSYPEKVMPAKEPVISLDIEDDEERIMQADWGNESDDEDDKVIMEKQHKRLSTVEREEIERADRESKGTWIKHTTDNGRPYYYNSITRQSVWEIPKCAAAVATTTSPAATLATNTNNTKKSAKTDPATDTCTRSDRSHSHEIPSSSRQPQPRSTSAPTVKTSSNAATPDGHRYNAKEKDGIKVQVQTKNDVSTTSTNTNTEKGKSSNRATKSTKTTLQSTERRISYSSRELSREKRPRLDMPHSNHRSGYITRRSRSRSPLPPPPPRDLYYDDYRYHHRSPSPPPYRHYPPYERYEGYYPYDDRIRHSPPPPPPDLRYRYYDLSPPPPSPPPYYRSRERSWERYEAAHRSRYYR